MDAFDIDDITGNPVDEWLGLTWEELSPERVVARCDLGEQHTQPYGLIHGGVWCAIVESVGSVAGGVTQHQRGQGSGVVGVNNDTDFIRAHRGGPVTAVGTPIHTGRSQQLWQIVITRDSDEQVVARGTLRLQNLEPGRVPGAGTGASS